MRSLNAKYQKYKSQICLPENIHTPGTEVFLVWTPPGLPSLTTHSPLEFSVTFLERTAQFQQMWLQVPDACTCTFPVCKCPAKATLLMSSGLSIKSAKYLQEIKKQFYYSITRHTNCQGMVKSSESHVKLLI